MTTALLKYDAARRALAEARSIDEVRDWEDKAAAVREYARRARNREMEINAAEIRVRAQCRRGELLVELKASGALIDGRKKTVTEEGPFPRVTLADLDTSKNESSHAQKLAAIGPDAFERLIARCRKRLEDNPEAHSFDVLRERDGPINGARSVMGSREEPSDSLDYFPTPPWATRALLEKVLRQLGRYSDCRRMQAWEPACGEGHIAGVLEEYFATVIASDVFDYTVAGRMPPAWWRTLDFLKPEAAPDGMPVVDWIITNPPFGDVTEQFVLRAIADAQVGVAMFVRLQWLETVGRYEAVFRDHPPTIIAFFAERVNLCKGRWDPDGSTATAYIWLVWINGAAPKPPFWIPPGQREALTRPGDRERFTAHPVLPRHDPETGEIVDLGVTELVETTAVVGVSLAATATMRISATEKSTHGEREEGSPDPITPMVEAPQGVEAGVLEEAQEGGGKGNPQAEERIESQAKAAPDASASGEGKPEPDNEHASPSSPVDEGSSADAEAVSRLADGRTSDANVSEGVTAGETALPPISDDPSPMPGASLQSTVVREEAAPPRLPPAGAASPLSDDEFEDIPDFIRRAEPTAEERAFIASVDLDDPALILNEKQLVRKLRLNPGAMTVVDRNYLAKIMARVPA